MMKEKIVFKISKTAIMTLIGFDQSASNLSMFDILEISILENRKRKLIIYENDNAVYGIKKLNALLKFCLNNLSKFNFLANNDIGYLWNEDLYNTNILANQNRHDEIED